MNLYYETELYHFGVKGMKWGVRRAEKKAAIASRKKKAENIISENEDDRGSDLKYIRESNKKLGSRVVSKVTKGIAGQLMWDMFTDNLDKYAKMNSNELTKVLTNKAIGIAKNTAFDIVSENVAAKSASKKFDDSGKRIKGTANKKLTKEFMIAKSVKTAVRATPIVGVVMKWKMSEAIQKRQANEARFKSWGGNILPEKTKTIGDTIWISDDGKTSLINPR